MAYRFTGTDPFLRASIGAFDGLSLESDALSWAVLLKRISTGAWQGIHVIDEGNTTPYTYMSEFNASDELSGGPDGVTASAATFTDTTDWIILGFTRAGGLGAGLTWTWRWKIGTGAWSSEADTYSGRSSTAGSTYRHVIGNEPGLLDDADFDLVCLGMIESELSQATFESLTMTDIASWDAVFTGASAMLLGFDDISTRTDRTGNGADEVSRSAGITLVSDPAGFDWGGGGASHPNRNYIWTP